MGINYLAIIIASILQFILGAIWYGPLFGKIWMKIHDCDNLSKEEMAKMQKEIMPYYGVQFVTTLITTVVLAMLMNNLPQLSPVTLVLMLWIGFIVPTQASAVIFGSDKKKWLPKKLSIMAGAALCCLLIAATVISMFQ